MNSKLHWAPSWCQSTAWSPQYRPSQYVSLQKKRNFTESYRAPIPANKILLNSLLFRIPCAKTPFYAQTPMTCLP